MWYNHYVSARNSLFPDDRLLHTPTGELVYDIHAFSRRAWVAGVLDARAHYHLKGRDPAIEVNLIPRAVALELQRTLGGKVLKHGKGGWRWKSRLSKIYVNLVAMLPFLRHSLIDASEAVVYYQARNNNEATELLLRKSLSREQRLREKEKERGL